MKIIVFSDSHHEINSMDYILQNENPDMVIHLGDNYSDAQTLKKMLPELSIESVTGNCDFENPCVEKTLSIEGKSFFITHGHKYGVKNGISRLVKKGMDEKADVILFGHTHKAHVEKKENSWIINPGSINRLLKMDMEPTFARIIIENDSIDCEIVESK